MILTIDSPTDVEDIEKELSKTWVGLPPKGLVSVLVKAGTHKKFSVTYTWKTGYRFADEMDTLPPAVSSSYNFQTALQDRKTRVQHMCGHFFVDYDGFREKYRYCKYCDEKEK